MQVVLKVVGGKNDGREIKIGVRRFLIGRIETAHLRPTSDLVSREHCEIVIDDEGAVIVNDLGSRNGSYINGTQLKKKHIASTGDILRVGRLQFEIVIDPAKAGVKKPKVSNVVEAASRTASRSAPKGSLEENITDWLLDEKDEESAALETVQLKLEETSVFGNSPREPKNEEEPDSTETGKLPEIPKKMHQSSTSAADDVLRKFFNRR